MDHSEKIVKSGSSILQKALIALERNICDHCLGRLFARSGFGLSNDERGKAIRIMLALSSENLGESSQKCHESFLDRLPVHHTIKSSAREDKRSRYTDENGWVVEPTPSFMGHLVEDNGDDKCWLCHDIFEDTDELVRLILDKVDLQEFRTFQLGSKMDPSTLERERSLWERVEPDNAEPLKEELNREVGKALAPKIPERSFERDHPDVTFILDPLFKTVDVKKNPLFIHGRYEKMVRGIPQTRWICKSCRGKGCSRCNGKGRMYETSVEEEIGEPLCAFFKGLNYKLHGKGREDVDVRCIGRGRPFIMEISEPVKRFRDLYEVEKKINEEGSGKVKVHDLRWSSRKDIPTIKRGDTLKRYSAVVSLSEGLDEEKLKYKASLLGQRSISQRTPRRVSHRRADLVRDRKVHEISVEILERERARIDLLTEGGLYIKELLHGDEGRTDPSLSSLIEGEVIVETLDVIDVMDEEDRIGKQG